jgi:hypothetical protein
MKNKTNLKKVTNLTMKNNGIITITLANKLYVIL